MCVFGVGIIEAALTQLTVETNQLCVTIIKNCVPPTEFNIPGADGKDPGAEGQEAGLLDNMKKLRYSCLLITEVAVTYRNRQKSS